MGFVMLHSTGLVTLGAAAFWATGAYASTMLVIKAGLSVWISILLGGIITAIIATGIGAVTVRLSKVAFVFLTIVVGAIVVLIVGRIDYFGGWGGIVRIPRPNPITLPVITIDFSTKAQYYYFILVILILNIVVFYALYNSRIGRTWRAIKLNLRLAKTLGINSFRYSLLAFVVAAIFASFAGSFYAHYMHTIEPDTFGFHKSVYIQVYGILGGMEYYIMGPVVGAIIMTILPEILRVTKEIEPIITGAILVIVVILLPGGFLSLPQIVRASTSVLKDNMLLTLLRNKVSSKERVDHGDTGS